MISTDNKKCSTAVITSTKTEPGVKDGVTTTVITKRDKIASPRGRLEARVVAKDMEDMEKALDQKEELCTGQRRVMGSSKGPGNGNQVEESNGNKVMPRN